MRFGNLLLAAGSLLASSCATPPPTMLQVEPLGEDDTLVVGRVVFDCQVARPGGVPVGEYRSDLDVEFMDMHTAKTIRVTAIGPEGLFVIHNPAGERLSLSRISYRQGSPRADGAGSLTGRFRGFLKKTGEAPFASVRPLATRTYVVRRGKVNNLGLLLWHGDMLNRTGRIEFNRGFTRTRADYARSYPESQWNRSEWVQCLGE